MTRIRSRQGWLVSYPERDGKRMAESTLQWDYNALIKQGLEDLFQDNPRVFVAGDLLWYPVEGNNKIRTAPDAMVAFGRPKGHRGSYLQWLENDIAPQVVFETLAPGNRAGELQKKFEFYETYGVHEYYVYDPERGLFSAWLRSGNRLEPVDNPIGMTSPRLGVRFDLRGKALVITGPDGKPFESYSEVKAKRNAALTVAALANECAMNEAAKAAEEKVRVDAALALAEEERRRAEEERRRAEEERARADRLAARLKALGIDPDADEGS